MQFTLPAIGRDNAPDRFNVLMQKVSHIAVVLENQLIDQRQLFGRAIFGQVGNLLAQLGAHAQQVCLGLINGKVNLQGSGIGVQIE